MQLAEIRRPKLKQMLQAGELIRGIEAHNALAAGMIEQLSVQGKKFNALWMSSLTETASRGFPDNEYLNLNARLDTLIEVMHNCSLPLIYDGDTGSFPEHLALTVKKLEALGVSALVIEDKKGLKQNSLLGSAPTQSLETIERFCEKIKIAKAAQKSQDFMLIARIESFILGAGLSDALNRAEAYLAAGADALMIHSKNRSSDEVLSFCEAYNGSAPLMLVPSTYYDLTETQAQTAGAQIVIYANHLLRASYRAMHTAASTILADGCAEKLEGEIASCQEIIQLAIQKPKD
jgi:phosphoenolpyruvate phosphomutase / 2-hydroxyethylphosphonate cytidylyltransferase